MDRENSGNGQAGGNYYYDNAGNGANGAGGGSNYYSGNAGMNPAPIPPAAKSKIVAALLGFFVGCFGVHNFYLGYTKKATIQCVAGVIGMLTTCIYIGTLVLFGIQVWAIVESVMILVGKIDRDANGIPLKD